MRRLGKTDIEITEIGLGCWQFSEGKGIVGRYWQPVPDEVVNEIVARTLAGGINWFDTAEAYGGGRSERALARALLANGKANGDVVVATKWRPYGRTAASIEATIGDRLAALSPFGIDLHQIHAPYGLSSVESEMAVMAGLVHQRKIRAVGVSNFGVSRMRRAHAALAECGLPLASNQVKYNLLDRRIERDGTLAAAKELGVTIIAYSPLAQGLLTGKFHDAPELATSIKGPRRFLPQFRSAALARIRPLIETLQAIAKAHGCSASQVALAWLVQFHGDTIVAIPGASRARQAVDNTGAMRLVLSQAELHDINTLSLLVS